MSAVEQDRRTRSDGQDVVFARTDVVDDEPVSALAELFRTRYGRVDVLVNNAAVFQ